MRIKDILNTPFPKPSRSRRNLIWIILVGLGSSMFILLYKPFGIENQTGELYVDLIIFSLGILFILAVLFMEWVIPAVIPSLFRNWTVQKAFIWYTLVILFVGAVIFLYKSLLSNFNEFTWMDFILVLGRILGIGIVVSFFVLGIWQYVNRKKFSLITINENYLITSQDGKSIRLNLNDILYIASDDNYVDIHYMKGESRTKLIFRSSLKNVESQIVNPLSPIIRCHRQYLINTEYFEIVNWTSRNMQIKLKSNDDLLPVSKQYADSVKPRLQFRP